MLSKRSHLQLTTAVFLTLSFIFQRLEIKARPEKEVKRTTFAQDAFFFSYLWTRAYRVDPDRGITYLLCARLWKRWSNIYLSKMKSIHWVWYVLCVSAYMYGAFFGTTVSNTKYIWCSVRICLADIYVVDLEIGPLRTEREHPFWKRSISIRAKNPRTEGVKQFHGSFHNTQRKRFQRLLLIESI